MSLKRKWNLDWQYPKKQNDNNIIIAWWYELNEEAQIQTDSTLD